MQIKWIIINIIPGMNMTQDSLKEARYSKNPHGLQIIIPTLNECETLPFILNELKQYTKNIIVIDGNSIDGTTRIAEEYGA